MPYSSFFKHKKFIIDFDSTIVTKEALDMLAEIALSAMSVEQQTNLLAEITATTRLGMEGKIGFADSLRRRMKILSGKISRQMVNRVATQLQNEISTFFIDHQSFFGARAHDVYVFSGGFEEMILPTAKLLGIHADHIFANQFLFENDVVVSIDETRLLAQDNGKILQLAELGLMPSEVIVIGDGSTDRKIKEAGYAHYFFAFTENIMRPGILSAKNGEQIADGTESDLAKLMAQEVPGHFP